MRQVPSPATHPLGIVGDGRVARHFHHYFTLLNLPVRTWSRRSAAISPVEALAACDTILVLIPDAAIEPFIAAWPGLSRTPPGPLLGQPRHAGRGVRAPADDVRTRPLSTSTTYRSIPFVLDAGRTPFHELLPGPAESVLHHRRSRSAVIPRALRDGRQLLHPALAEALRRARRPVRQSPRPPRIRFSRRRPAT